MLESLSIRNFALFEEISLCFGEGLHVLTGETGAGKSLVVDAVNFLCGAKADRDIIRAGRDKVYVEGSFQISDVEGIKEALQSQSLESEDEFLLISRELNANGRSVCRVNGVVLALSSFREITSHLLDLHGQHEHQSLFLESKHLAFLDRVGDQSHQGLLLETQAAYETHHDLLKQVQEKQKSRDRQQERMETLQKQEKELENAKLEAGEEERLQQSRERLRNADRINHALTLSMHSLTDPEDDGETALDLVRMAHRKLGEIASLDDQYSQFEARAGSLYYELEELGHDIRAALGAVDSDAYTLDEVETRLDVLRKLNRKYGSTSEEMMEELQRIKDELQQIAHFDNDLEELIIKEGKAKQAYLLSARKLSASRKALSQKFEKSIESSLSELNMAGTRFRVEITSNEEHIRPTGIDSAAMQIAPNAGEGFKPLSKIASGGELSRLMLAMKAVSAQTNEVPTMVFDEIDTGVSGQTALVIAMKLWDIARFRQVICVTHLHHLAAMANRQYLVRKQESDQRTQTEVQLLNDDARQNEIAKMLGDLKTQGKSSLDHAEVLLRDAASYRAQHPLQPVSGR